MPAQGRQVFREFCARCHGGGGEGARACCRGAGPPLAGGGLTRWQVRAAVRQGIPPGMPAFGGRLSDAEIKAVAAYVQTLAAGRPAE
ncbi:MAG: cytochrome c [Gemmataceae bacterium]|nr:cytochrome c [Gemmataceae bacterium]